MMSFRVSAILPASPVHSPGKRAEKSPFLNATNVFSNSFALSESVVRVSVLMIFSFRRFQNCEERADDQSSTSGFHVEPCTKRRKCIRSQGEINCVRGFEKRRVGGLVVWIVITCRGRFCKPIFPARVVAAPNNEISDPEPRSGMNHHCKVSASELHFRKFTVRYELCRSLQGYRFDGGRNHEVPVAPAIPSVQHPF